MLSINNFCCFVAVILIPFVTADNSYSTSTCHEWAKAHHSLSDYGPQKAEVMSNSSGTSVSRLTRRYDLRKAVDVIAGSEKTGQPGACGKYYDSNKDEGVCLYNGQNGINTQYPRGWGGWLNWDNKANCAKTLWIHSEKVKLQGVQILDACPMSQTPLTPDAGCPQIMVTAALAKKLQSTYIVKWGFYNSIPA